MQQFIRLTWNQEFPAPFESAWSVFAKLIALNYCQPVDIVVAIKKESIDKHHSLDIRDSSWIDFNRFGAALGIAPSRLRMCFLDQLGFPKHTNNMLAGIRHCRECLNKGYHSVFFDLAILSKCPVHGCTLEKPCTDCYAAIFSRGLRQYPSDLKKLNGENSGIYRTSCCHIYFVPDDFSWLTGRMSESEEKNITYWSYRFLHWWRKVISSTDIRAPMAIGLSGKDIDDRYRDDIANQLGVAESLAGTCPWPTSVPARNRDWLSWTDSKRSPLTAAEQFAMYRAVRLHLYRRYIRPHQRCWKDVSNLSWKQSKALRAQSICTMALAYATWRMVFEGFCNVEGFKVKRRKVRLSRILHVDDVSVFEDPAACGRWLYALFFAILEQIEYHSEDDSFNIEKTSWDWDLEEIYNISWSHLHLNVGQEADSSGRWWLTFPERACLIRKTFARCVGTKKGTASMVSGWTMLNLDQWSWTRRYSESNMPQCMFRIRRVTRLGNCERVNVSLVV